MPHGNLRGLNEPGTQNSKNVIFRGMHSDYFWEWAGQKILSKMRRKEENEWIQLGG